jgi:hypothetical protein
MQDKDFCSLLDMHVFRRTGFLQREYICSDTPATSRNTTLGSTTSKTANNKMRVREFQFGAKLSILIGESE